MIAPPYFPLDGDALLAHFAAAARACAPMPFYVYEFARASGYAVPLDVLERCASEAPNFVGLKVSDSPWDAFAPYLLEGLDVFVGPEALIAQGMRARRGRRGVGARVGFPERVAAAVRDRRRRRRGDRRAARRDRALPVPRRAQARSSRDAACRFARTCARRCGRCRDDEREELDRWLESS